MTTVNIPIETARKVLEACPLYARRDAAGDVWIVQMTGEQYQHLRELVDACHRAVHGEQTPLPVARAGP